MSWCLCNRVMVACVCLFIASPQPSVVGSEPECTTYKKPSDKYYDYCNMTINMHLVHPANIGYGNAGYPRVEDMQLTVTCHSWFNNAWRDTLGYLYMTDGVAYKSQPKYPDPRLPFNFTKTFLAVEPGAQFQCQCLTKPFVVRVKPELRSCWVTESFTVPNYKICRQEVCQKNGDKDFCLQDPRSGQVLHQKPDTSCLPYASWFQEGCGTSTSAGTLEGSNIQFALTTEDNKTIPLKSGSLFYKMDTEEWTLTTDCPTASSNWTASVQCYIMGAHSSNQPTPKQNYKHRILEPNGNKFQGCKRQYTISRRTLYLRGMLDRTLVNYMIGCQSHNVKLLEIYLKVIKPVEMFETEEGPKCVAHLSFPETVTVYPVGVSADKCVCMFQLVACTPQVTVTHINHTFKCNASALPTRTLPDHAHTISVHKPDKLASASTETEGLHVVTYLVIGLAVLMLIVTVAIIVVVVFQTKRRRETVVEPAKSAKDCKPLQVILAPSMFQSNAVHGVEESSSSGLSPIHRLSLMDEMKDAAQPAQEHEASPTVNP